MWAGREIFTSTVEGTIALVKNLISYSPLLLPTPSTFFLLGRLPLTWDSFMILHDPLRMLRDALRNLLRFFSSPCRIFACCYSLGCQSSSSFLSCILSFNRDFLSILIDTFETLLDSFRLFKTVSGLTNNSIVNLSMSLLLPPSPSDFSSPSKLLLVFLFVSWHCPTPVNYQKCDTSTVDSVFTWFRLHCWHLVKDSKKKKGKKRPKMVSSYEQLLQNRNIPSLANNWSENSTANDVTPDALPLNKRVLNQHNRTIIEAIMYAKIRSLRSHPYWNR